MAQATSQARRGGLWYGWVVLATNFVVYGLIVGFVAYAYPVIFPAMVAERGWGRGEASAPITVGTWLLAVGYPALGWTVNRLGGRATIFLGGLALGVVFIALSQVTELWHWFVLRSFFWAVAAALCGIVPYQVIATLWFNLRRGLAMGLTLMGAAVFGFLAPTVSTAIMQAAGSWQMGWAAVGVIYIVAAIIGGLFLRSKPSDMGTWPDGLPPEEAQRAREAALAGRASQYRAIATTYRSPVNWRLGDALRTRAAWLTMLTWGALAMAAQFVMTQSVFMLRAIGYSAMEAAFSIALVTGASTPFRFIMGWLTDRVESRFIIAGGLVLTFVGLAMLRAMPSGNLPFLYVYSALLGIGYLGLTYPAISVQVGNYFGAGSFAIIFTATVLPVGTALGALAPMSAGYIFDAFKSYDLAFIIFMVVATLGIVMALLATPPRPKEVAARPAS